MQPFITNALKLPTWFSSHSVHSSKTVRHPIIKLDHSSQKSLSGVRVLHKPSTLSSWGRILQLCTKTKNELRQEVKLKNLASSMCYLRLPLELLGSCLLGSCLLGSCLLGSCAWALGISSFISSLTCWSWFNQFSFWVSVI